jgi:membrane protein DedA with SNARE-associated domain
MSVPLAQLIPVHGYWLAFVGALFEGETVLALAGLAAHRGYLSFPILVGLGALGGFLGDQIGFVVGRRFGDRLAGRFPRLAAAMARAQRLVERYPHLSVIAVRFVYGVRIAGPVVIGTSRLPWPTFAALNALGALVWSACWVAAGYLAGTAVEAALGHLKLVEHVLFATALVVAVAVSVWLHLRRRRGYPPRPPQREE